jgi:hypothetical protein
MDEKHLVPAYAFILTIAFLIISFLVFITRGNPYLIQKKLKVGALLIYLTGSSVGCPVMTCYAPVPPNRFVIDQKTSNSNEISLNVSTNDTLTGRIERRAGTSFSFAITDTTDSLMFQSEDILPADGAYDQSTEAFRILVRKDLTPGLYHLFFFDVPKDSITIRGLYYPEYTLRVQN